MTSATLEMPLPGGPLTSTSARVRATARTLSRSPRAKGDVPNSIRDAGSPASSWAFRRRFSSTSARVFRARSTSARRSAAAQGFSRKPKAPCPMARTAMGISPSPVSRITGRSGSSLRVCSSRKKPSRPGMRMSDRITPSNPSEIWSFASMKLPVQRGARSASSSVWASASRTAASSSTINTCRIMPQPPGRPCPGLRRGSVPP